MGWREKRCDVPFWVPNTGMHLVVTLRNAELLYFTLLTNPSRGAVDSTKLLELKKLCLDTMEWAMCHMPVMERKSAIHIGMPGVFHNWAAHLSQHGGAQAEVELCRPCGCKCTRSCTAAELEEEWGKRRRDLDGIARSAAKDLNHLMPTEHARQAALPQNLCTPYAACRKVLEAVMLENQHGFCQSAGNKASVGHGDGNNHGQFNWLAFHAGKLLTRQLAAEPSRDLGIWSQEGGRVLTRLADQLDLLFNSAADHCVVPHMELLPYVRDVAGMRSKGNAFAALRTAEALEQVQADSTLMQGFQEELMAAQLHSSLVGSTLFQQQGVTNQCMRAAEIGRPESVLRGFGPDGWERHRERPEAEPISQDAKRAADLEKRKRVLELHTGNHVRVVWETGEVHDAKVVETKVALELRDIGVRLRYASGRVLEERLGCMEWKVIRAAGSESEVAPAAGRHRWCRSV